MRCLEGLGRGMVRVRHRRGTVEHREQVRGGGEMNKRRPGYRMVAFPRARRLMITIGRVSRHRHIMHGLVELDVSRARQLMREHQARTGEKLSFTAFVATCVGHAVAMNPEVQAYRTWRSQLVLFEDVDIAIMVEKDLQGQKVAVSHIVRAANT